MDAETAAFIARLAVQDLEEAQASLSDEQLAAKVQAEWLASEDEQYARSLAGTFGADAGNRNEGVVASGSNGKSRAISTLLSDEEYACQLYADSLLASEDEQYARSLAGTFGTNAGNRNEGAVASGSNGKFRAMDTLLSDEEYACQLYADSLLASEDEQYARSLAGTFGTNAGNRNEGAVASGTNGKSRAMETILSDEEYALQLQAESSLVSEDVKFARSLAKALNTDADYLDALNAAEEAAAQDRLIAEMVSRGEDFPPPMPSVQRRVENPTSVRHPEPPVVAVPSPAAKVEQDNVGERLVRGLRPKYLRYNLWEEYAPFSRCAAEWTETAAPLPSPPKSELDDPVVNRTIAENPHLFEIVTPVNVDRFEELLRDHPNPAFVSSVCRGLREGFWPWADTHKEGFPTTHNASLPLPRDPVKAEFLRTQCATEVRKRRFSPPFGPNLLPGMYSMPIHAVPKPHSTDMRMITDHSFGEFSLNAMINRSDISGYPLDNMSHLGEILLCIRQDAKDRPLTLFKSDVAEAYRLLPVHPFWQIKQVNTVNGSTRYVDRNNAFGGRGSGSIWIAFNSLVTWIAVNVRGLTWLRVYSDDSFSPEWSDKLTWDDEFQREMPTGQVALLNLWRELGIPYKPAKQISGTSLTIIGIEVDPNAMTMTLPQTARDKLLDEITDFCRPECPGARDVRQQLANIYDISFLNDFSDILPYLDDFSDILPHLDDFSDILPHTNDFSNILPRTNEVEHPLRRWQQLAGWMNWAFNVYPLLRPALNNFYCNIAVKEGTVVAPGHGTSTEAFNLGSLFTTQAFESDNLDPTFWPWIGGATRTGQMVRMTASVRRDLEWAARHVRASNGVHLLRSLEWDVGDADVVIYSHACPNGMGFWYPATSQGFHADAPVNSASNATLITFNNSLCILAALENAVFAVEHFQRIVIFTEDPKAVSMFSSLRAKPEYNEILKASVDCLFALQHQLRVLHVSTQENTVASAISRRQLTLAREHRPQLEVADFDPPLIRAPEVEV